MTQEISALMDGETSTADVDGIIKACHQNEQHKDAWRCYHLIGEALRSEHQHRPGLEQRILSLLSSEPTVLAPRRKAVIPSFPRIALAAAASLATVSAVAWLAFQQAPAPQPKMAIVAPPPVAQSVVNPVDDFVLAHREFTAAPDVALIPASFGTNGNGDAQR
jgi:sigma-E factor negative regulatory protein RseA